MNAPKMKFVIHRKSVDFDGYAALRMFQNKADSLEKCRQLWEEEVGKKYLDLTKGPHGTWMVEVTEKELVDPGTRTSETVSTRTLETLSTVYQ